MNEHFEIHHYSEAELSAQLPHILSSPKEEGILKIIVRRPDVDEREIIEEGRLSFSDGLEGDSWKKRSSRHTGDGSAFVEMQLNIMNFRIIRAIAGSKERCSLAGDQLIIDMDLSDENIPVGTKLAIGSAEVEITDPPHTGCQKFKERFGKDAHIFVNRKWNVKHHFRGVNARVTKEGDIKTGDKVIKLKS